MRKEDRARKPRLIKGDISSLKINWSAGDD